MANFFYNELSRLTERMPKRTAINLHGKNISYSELFIKSEEIANILHSRSIKKIAIIDNHTVPVYLFIFACLFSEVVFSVIRNDENCSYIVANFNPDLILCSEKEKLNINIDWRHRIVADENIDNIFGKQQTKFHNDSLYVSWTSGVTGIPKGAIVSSKGIEIFLRWSASFFSYGDSYKWGEPTDLFHDLGVVNLLIAVYNMIEYVPIREGVDKVFFARFINNNEITHFRTVPRYIDFITRACKLNKTPLLDSLQFVGFGGDLLFQDKVEELLLFHKQLDIYNTYGATETSGFNSVALFNRRNINEYSHNNRISIGKPIDGNCFYISDDRELIVENTNMFHGYIGEEMINDGNDKYYTNDLATIYDNNYYIVGRKNRSGKHKGQKVFLDTLDNFVSMQLFCQVRSVLCNDELVLFTIKNGTSEKHIYDLLKNSDQFYNLSPRLIFIDTFEYNENYKIDDNRLIEKYLTG